MVRSFGYDAEHKLPVLEISPEMISADERTELTLAYIRGVMLWPHDAEKRADAISTDTASFIHQVGVAPEIREALAVEWPDLVALALQALPPRLIAERAELPFVHGFLAGELLAAAVQMHATTGAVKLEALKHQMLDPRRRDSHRLLDMSRSTLENSIWGRFRPVAHLWAAFAYRALQAGDSEFPCRLRDVSDFLALAEFFGLQGTQIKPMRRADPLLDEALLWVFPAELPLPGYVIDR